MLNNIFFIILLSFSFLFAENDNNVSVTELLLKAKEEKNVALKKKYLRESFQIRPTLYAIKMLLKLNRKNPAKCLRIIEFSYKVFPINKFLTEKGIKYSFKLGLLDKAEFFIFNYLKYYPLDKDILFLLGEFYERKGNISLALRTYKTIYKLYDNKKAKKKIEEVGSIFN